MFFIHWLLVLIFIQSTIAKLELETEYEFEFENEDELEKNWFKSIRGRVDTSGERKAMFKGAMKGVKGRDMSFVKCRKKIKNYETLKAEGKWTKHDEKECGVFIHNKLYENYVCPIREALPSSSLSSWCENPAQGRQAIQCFNCGNQTECASVGNGCDWVDHPKGACRYYHSGIKFTLNFVGFCFFAFLLVWSFLKFCWHKVEHLLWACCKGDNANKQVYTYYARELRWLSNKTNVIKGAGFWRNYKLHLTSYIPTGKICCNDEAHYTSAWEAWVIFLITFMYASYQAVESRFSIEVGHHGLSNLENILIVSLPCSLTSALLYFITRQNLLAQLTSDSSRCWQFTCDSMYKLLIISLFGTSIYLFLLVTARLPYLINPSCFFYMLIPYGWFYTEIINFMINSVKFIVQWRIDHEKGGCCWRCLGTMLGVGVIELTLNHRTREKIEKLSKTDHIDEHQYFKEIGLPFYSDYESCDEPMGTCCSGGNQDTEGENESAILLTNMHDNETNEAGAGVGKNYGTSER